MEMLMLNKAIEIANCAHAGQVDKGGAPYILHPLRVMMTREDEMERICAVLHDVVEDTVITLEDIRSEGFSSEIIHVLDCLTRRAYESYDDFVNRILVNETACQVKLADLCDNMNISRIKNPTQEDRERIIKYGNAADKISYELLLKGESIEERMIEINGCVSIQPFLSHDDFLDRFIDFVELNGWSFGGGTEDVTHKEDN